MTLEEARLSLCIYALWRLADERGGGFKGWSIPLVVAACSAEVPDCTPEEVEAAAQRVLAALAPQSRPN